MSIVGPRAWSLSSTCDFQCDKICPASFETTNELVGICPGVTAKVLRFWSLP